MTHLIRNYDEAMDLLQQLKTALKQSADAYVELTEVCPEVMNLLNSVVAQYPLLSEAWTAYDAQIGAWKDRANTGFHSARALADWLTDARDLLEEGLEKSDFYAVVDPADKKWKILHRHNGLKKRVMYNEDQYSFFWNKIRSGENFTLMRNGDGEIAIMEGRPLTEPTDLWSSPGGDTPLGRALKESLKIVSDNVYYGISCPCCDPHGYGFYMNHIANKDRITFANIWANANYERFEKDFASLKRDAVVIANHRGMNKPVGALNVLGYFPVGDACVSFWEERAQGLIDEIIASFGTQNDLLYVVSAGPMSGPIISALYRNNPDNTYVDFGSSISNYIHEKPIRFYMMQEQNPYKEQKCWMPISQNTPRPEITVVMTLYRRPEVMTEQLEAIEAQTIAPKEIILFQDAVPDTDEQYVLPDELKMRFSKVKICEENQGVWGRFRYALENATSEYICLLDDDTIPGIRWLENCYMHMIQKEGIYVTVGITLRQDALYPQKNYYRVGWTAPYQRDAEVDFGGHAWFVRRKHLEVMLRDADVMRRKYKYVAEDMWLSVSNAMEEHVPTVVPKHCAFDGNFWGSIPDRSYQYGVQEHALSMQSANLYRMAEAMLDVRAGGWLPMVETREKYVEQVFEDVKGMDNNAALNTFLQPGVQKQV